MTFKELPIGARFRQANHRPAVIASKYNAEVAAVQP